jgi:hypothetical protein
MARFARVGQDPCNESFLWNLERHVVVEERMLAPKLSWQRLALERNAQLHGVRMLCRASFVLIIATASIMNEADQAARAVGLLSVRVEGSPLGLGTHACMQPSAEDVPDEPEPVKPPCPRSGR